MYVNLFSSLPSLFSLSPSNIDAFHHLTNKNPFYSIVFSGLISLLIFSHLDPLLVPLFHTHPFHSLPPFHHIFHKLFPKHSHHQDIPTILQNTYGSMKTEEEKISLSLSLSLSLLFLLFLFLIVRNNSSTLYSKVSLSASHRPVLLLP